MEDSTAKYVKIAGIAMGTVGLGAIAFHFLGGRGKKTGGATASTLTLEKTILISKQIKKELYVIFQTAAQLAGEVKMQTRGQIPQDQIVAMVQEHPHIRGEIVNVLSKIYQKNDVTEAQFEAAATGPHNNNPEILKIRENLKAQFDRACSGVPPEAKTELPASLTAEKTIEVVKKTMIASAKKLQQVFVEIAEREGSFNIQDPKVIQTLNTIKMDDMKDAIYNEYGLNNYEDSGAKILQFALQTYQMKDMGFAQKYGALELKHRSAMDQILTNPQGVNVDQIFANDGGFNMGGFPGGGGGQAAGGFNPSRPGARTKPTTEKKEEKEVQEPVKEENNTEKTEDNQETPKPNYTKLSNIAEEEPESKQSDDQKEGLTSSKEQQKSETNQQESENKNKDVQQN